MGVFLLVATQSVTNGLYFQCRHAPVPKSNHTLKSFVFLQRHDIQVEPYRVQVQGVITGVSEFLPDICMPA